MFRWDPWTLEPGFPHCRVLRAGTVITAVLGGGFVGVVLLLVLRIPDLPPPAMAVGVVLALGIGMLMARRLLRGTWIEAATGRQVRVASLSWHGDLAEAQELREMIASGDLTRAMMPLWPAREAPGKGPSSSGPRRGSRRPEPAQDIAPGPTPLLYPAEQYESRRATGRLRRGEMRARAVIYAPQLFPDAPGGWEDGEGLLTVHVARHEPGTGREALLLPPLALPADVARRLLDSAGGYRGSSSGAGDSGPAGWSGGTTTHGGGDDSDGGDGGGNGDGGGDGGD